MKEVLEYTEDELKLLSLDELKVLLKDAEYGEALFNTRQLTEKTLINSLYGAIGNKYFPLFNEAIAGAITGNGRFFIRKLANRIEEELQRLNPIEEPYVIAGDTDSCYAQIAPFMDMYQSKNPGLEINEYVEWADQFDKKIIKPVITKCISDFAFELNAYNEDVMGVDREAIADAGVFIAKKCYFLRVRDNEGTRYPADSPYIKRMGLQLIKSSTPVWSKKYLNEAIPKILDLKEIDLVNWIKSIKAEFQRVNLNEIAAIGGVSRIDYDLTEKGVPIGARSAIRHNNYILEKNLENTYQTIQGGDKCKKLFLITPNKFNSNIIAYTNDSFINEISHSEVDYDMQFYKTFLKPLELMVESLQYNLEKETESLDDW